MVNQSKKEDPRHWRKCRESGGVGNIYGPSVGVAYAFFDSSASMREIEELAVNEAKRIAKIDRKRKGYGRLEYFLTEVKDINIEEVQDSELYAFMQNNPIYPTFPSDYKDQMKNAKPIKMTDLKYALFAAREGATDTKTAGYLGNVMNDVYQKYGEGKPFNVAVVYRNPKDGYLDFKQD